MRFMTQTWGLGYTTADTVIGARTLVVRPKNLSGLLASRLMGPSALRLLTLTAARTSPSLASGATSTGIAALMFTYSTRRDSCAQADMLSRRCCYFLCLPGDIGLPKRQKLLLKVTPG